MGLFDNLFVPDMDLGLRQESMQTENQLASPVLTEQAIDGTLPPTILQPATEINTPLTIPVTRTEVPALPIPVTVTPDKSDQYVPDHGENVDLRLNKLNAYFSTPESPSITSPMSPVPPTATAEAPQPVGLPDTVTNGQRPKDPPVPDFVNKTAKMYESDNVDMTDPIVPRQTEPGTPVRPTIVSGVLKPDQFTLQHLESTQHGEQTPADEKVKEPENAEVKELKEQVANLTEQLDTIKEQVKVLFSDHYMLGEKVNGFFRNIRKGLEESNIHEEPSAIDVTHTEGLHLVGENNGLDSKLPTMYTEQLPQSTVNIDPTTVAIANNVSGVDKFIDKLSAVPVQTAA